MKPPTDLDTARKRKAWAAELLKDGNGRVVRGLANTMSVLALHPDWHGVIVYDEFAGCIRKASVPPTRPQDGAGVVGVWMDEDTANTAAWFASIVGFEPTPTHVDQAVHATAKRNAIHPVRDYLRALPWDGTPRLDSVLATYFGARPTPYTQNIGARFLISAVARIMQPGSQADCMLVLEGKQGSGKSTGLAALFSSEWFADTGVHIGEKDSYQTLRAKWCYEFGELAALKGREVERVKSFVSARIDTYRPSYARRSVDFPRQNVFAGTTNELEYLTDSTGNRRFWPVSCGTVDVSALRRDRGQIWAEARTRFDAGESWHVDSPELRALCEQEQGEREVEDPWVEEVRTWLSLAIAKGDVQAAQGFTTTTVLEALRLRPVEMTRAAQTRLGHVLKALGWEKRQLRRDGDVRRLYFPSSQPSQRETLPSSDVVGLQNEPENNLSLPSQPDLYTHTYAGKKMSASFLGGDGCDSDEGSES